MGGRGGATLKEREDRVEACVGTKSIGRAERQSLWWQMTAPAGQARRRSQERPCQCQSK